jgi:hypothetical protein
MRWLKPVKESELNREHVIQGTWSTRTLRIDGQEITVEMVKARLHADGWYTPGGFVDVWTFAWGATATPQELQVLAYSCCEFAVPERLTQYITSRFAIEQFFTAYLRKLPSADFTRRYTDRELRATMRRIKRGRGAPYEWSHRV